MSDHLYVQKDPSHLPARWFYALVGAFGAGFAFMFYMGMSIQEMKSDIFALKAQAQEQGEEMKYRANVLRPELANEIKMMRNDISEIKGMLNEMRRKR